MRRRGSKLSAAVNNLGRSDGTFGEQQAFQTGRTPADVVTGDFNGDGKLDIASGNQGEGTVTALLNSASRPALAASPIVNAASFASPPLTVAPGEIVTIFGETMGLGCFSTRRRRRSSMSGTTRSAPWSHIP